jgi:hypothetical protein
LSARGEGRREIKTYIGRFILLYDEGKEREGKTM